MSSNNWVLVGGVFDPLHAGHVAYLEAAKKLGKLVCAVSDAPEKHPPLVPLVDRVKLLHALGVNRVIAHNGHEIPEIIKDIRPIAYVKGIDWEGRLPAVEVETCGKLGTRIVFTDTPRRSSSDLLAQYESARNAGKLAAFEHFVQTQTRHPDPWVPVTDYSREGREPLELPHAWAIKDTINPTSVLDYGCGFGHLVSFLNDIGVNAVGWDPERRPDELALSRKYDLVICREVLEHLEATRIVNTIWAFVRMYSSRYIYLTTRFTAKSHLLDADSRDDLDPTHITMLNQDFVRALFVLNGCTRRADLETALDWQNKGRVLVYEVPRD